MTEKKQTLHEALFAVQQAAPFIDKATDNPFFKSKYASMPDIWHAIKDLLGENKLLVMHQLEVIDGADYIATTIHHIPSGDMLLSRSKISLSKSTAQEYGSYITYMRRYAVSAMLGLITDNDDDGNAASQSKQKTEQKKPATWMTDEDVSPEVWLKSKIDRLDDFAHRPKSTIQKLIEGDTLTRRDPIFIKLNDEQRLKYDEAVKSAEFSLKAKNLIP